MPEDIADIIRAGVLAPSGDNVQPWRFEVKNNEILVCNVPEADNSLFNYKQHASYIALGAAVENMRTAAEDAGYRSALMLLPEGEDSDCAASLTLDLDASVHNELAPYIGERVSNRKKYNDRLIDPKILASLSDCAEEFDGRVAFITDKDGVAEMAHTVSAGEKLVIENRAVHDFLFEHVTWSKKEDDAKHGFFIDTFEFAPPQKLAFKLFSHWHILKFFVPLGVGDFIAHDQEKVYRTSAAFGAISMPGSETLHYLKTGMALQRLWLRATQFGLALQPTTAVHLLAIPLLEGVEQRFSYKHRELILNRHADMRQAFGISKSQVITFVFRIGHADSPSGRTTRHEPVVRVVH